MNKKKYDDRLSYHCFELPISADKFVIIAPAKDTIRKSIFRSLRRYYWCLFKTLAGKDSSFWSKKEFEDTLTKIMEKIPNVRNKEKKSLIHYLTWIIWFDKIQDWKLDKASCKLDNRVHNKLVALNQLLNRYESDNS